ncbi:hypothetical protein ATO3_20290 [Marinibacterium profundimaris]|uniref:FecR protein domain-containing protein n=1 Tax=Marinibacterium profundimaris TaxID=1679460 RepID=A0A225NE91_9RHOB|nr:hypothetical protein ATO3_20290 [Marinibacterium profundimaris]
MWRIGLLLACMMGPTSLPAAEADLNAPLEVVDLSDQDTLRGIVERYLGDPDLWPTVLKINDIASPADLVPGIQLRLPVRQVKAADEALKASLLAIQRATAEGARIFAPVQIGDAIRNRETAVSSRELGLWREAVDFSAIATGFANEALDISIRQRDRSAEAIVSDVQGRVEGRAPAEPSWSDRQLDDILVEFERLRTLSASTTQVTFRDLSRLRLNPNSNATIQRMRSDPLTGGEVTKVSLVEGDFYALLNQLSDKSQFEIDVPGVETTTNSADFWIKNDRTGARFVNYDTPELEIRQGGDRITVGEGEGVVLTGQGAERTRVLTAPRLVYPAPGETIYTRSVTLTWDVFEGAQAYWLEVARDAGFNQMQTSEWGLRETGFEGALPPGRYHWRVAALDALGLPGEWSTAQDFAMRVDTTPPFLTLLAPGPGVISDEASVEVLGASEPDAQITLNGIAVTPGRDGAFIATLPLAPGPNTISVTAVDPAGNSSARSLDVVYRLAVAVDIALSPDIPRLGDALATKAEELSVLGTTNAQPGAPVVVRDPASGTPVLRAEVGPAGEIGFTVPVDEAARAFTIEILSPAGATEGSTRFQAVQDRTPPDVVLDLPPPRATGDPDVTLAGSAGDAVWLELNGAPVPLEAGRFEVTVPLERGQNPFELLASDAVGNVIASKLQTLYDIDPPEVTSVELGRPSGPDGPIELIVMARDASGLVQAAPFLIAIGGAEREGFLRCDSETGTCRASLPAEPGALELIEVVIEDYAGNAAFE